MFEHAFLRVVDWIPDYLEKSTQAALRVKMAEPPSESDEPGYVYAYEVRGTLTHCAALFHGITYGYFYRSRLPRSAELVSEGWLHR